MERSHLQPQVVFQRTAKIEGESQTLLEAKLLSTAVLVLYTSMHAGRGREMERRDSKQREEVERGREGRPISLSMIRQKC